MRSRANRHSEPPKRPAAFIKSNWRDVVADANAHGEVIVTNHNRPEVMVISMERYQELRREAEANDPLAVLRAEFDRELAVLNEPGAGARLREAFRATPAQLAAAANAAALARNKK
jgi:prevent-host-death family protein